MLLRGLASVEMKVAEDGSGNSNSESLRDRR